MRSTLWHRLTLCFIFSAIAAGILINLSDTLQAIGDLFGV